MGKKRNPSSKWPGAIERGVKYKRRTMIEESSELSIAKGEASEYERSSLKGFHRDKTPFRGKRYN